MPPIPTPTSGPAIISGCSSWLGHAEVPNLRKIEPCATPDWGSRGLAAGSARRRSQWRARSPRTSLATFARLRGALAALAFGNPWKVSGSPSSVLGSSWTPVGKVVEALARQGKDLGHREKTIKGPRRRLEGIGSPWEVSRGPCNEALGSPWKNSAHMAGRRCPSGAQVARGRYAFGSQEVAGRPASGAHSVPTRCAGGAPAERRRCPSGVHASPAYHVDPGFSKGLCPRGTASECPRGGSTSGPHAGRLPPGRYQKEPSRTHGTPATTSHSG